MLDLLTLERMTPAQLTEHGYYKIIHQEYNKSHVGYIKIDRYHKAFRYARLHLKEMQQQAIAFNSNVADILQGRLKIPYAVSADIIRSLTL